MPFDDPRGRVEDILDAAIKIQRYTAGLTQDSFEADERTIDAVIYNFVIIGEAASHVSPAMMARFPAIPWNQMRGLRNVAVHEYPRVNMRVIWETITLHLPPLIPQLRNILEREQ